MSNKPEFKPFNSKEVVEKIVSCMNDLADAHGVARCGLMYAMAQLVDALNQGVNSNEGYYKNRIKELEKRLSKYEDSNEAAEPEEGGLMIGFVLGGERRNEQR